jgi:hypothetical protein
MPHKTTTGGNVTDVLLAGVLGAAVLAIVLLARSVRRLTEQTTQLRAEVTAQKIAALQQRAPAPAPVEEELEPARRKRHLTLYIGGGAAAFLASLGERLRAALKRHRRATAAGTAVVVAAASTAAALYLTSNDTHPSTGGAHPLATATGKPGDDADNGDQAAPVAHTPSISPDTAGHRGYSIEQQHGNPSPTPSLSAPQELDTTASPSPAESGLDESSPPVSAKPPATPTPSTPVPSAPVPEPSGGGQTDGGEPEDDSGCLVHIRLPLLADLCV